MLTIVRIIFDIFLYLFLCLLLILFFVIKVDCQENLSNFNKPKPLVQYPVTGKTPFPMMTQSELNKVNEALTLAKELTKECSCDKALQDYGIESLSILLQSEANVSIFDGRRSTLGLPWINGNGERETVSSYFTKNQDWLWAGVIQTPFTGRGNILFLNNYFFSPNKAVTSALQQRAIILIHESVHQHANKDDKYFGGSQRLTMLITDACLPSLKMR
ncbi:MAG: hypothetical protein FD167_1691 [bacterium]|nr:MAG: hypothetical protein FD167_1691 [bacterium]